MILYSSELKLSFFCSICIAFISNMCCWKSLKMYLRKCLKSARIWLLTKRANPGNIYISPPRLHRAAPSACPAWAPSCLVYSEPSSPTLALWTRPTTSPSDSWASCCFGSLRQKLTPPSPRRWWTNTSCWRKGTPLVQTLRAGRPPSCCLASEPSV